MIKFLGIMSLLFAAFTAWAAPNTGDPAPDFSLKASDGHVYKLSQFKGKAVVLEWFNKDCPFVRKYYDSRRMQALQKENVGAGVVWLTITSSAPGKQGFLTPAAASKVREEKGMNSTALLLDQKSDVARLYGAKTTPHMFVIDKAGRVAYEGAIDDQPSANPETLQGAHNYVASALDSLNKGKPIAEASTTPYGCSVKY